MPSLVMDFMHHRYLKTPKPLICRLPLLSAKVLQVHLKQENIKVISRALKQIDPFFIPQTILEIPIMQQVVSLKAHQPHHGRICSKSDHEKKNLKCNRTGHGDFSPMKKGLAICISLSLNNRKYRKGYSYYKCCFCER